MAVLLYLQNVEAALKSSDGVRLARLFSLRHSPALRMKAQEFSRVDLKRCSEVVRAPLDVVAFSHLKAMEFQTDPKTAFTHQRNAVKNFKQFMSSVDDANWILPPLEQLTLDLRLLASKVDDVASRTAEKSDSYESAMTDIRECFVVVSSDRSSLHTSKKWGMMFLVNHLYFISFKLNNFAMVESLRRAMMRDTEMMDFFHMSHRVTYRYNLGRVALLNSQYAAAETELSFAFQHCHRSSTTNKRLLLIHLIPVNILRGRLPSVELLEKYDLTQFVDLTDAIRSGNVRQFKDALSANQPFFVQWGILLILERALCYVFRRLVKRV
jgi:hypothetical protein